MKKPSYPITAFFFICCCVSGGKAQSYHALNGSPYAGVTAMYVNPASTINQSFSWDVTIFGLQSTLANTSFMLKSNSSAKTNATAFLTEGLHERHFDNNVDLNLFDLRFDIDKKSVFGLGFRMRMYNHADGQPFNYKDTTSTVNSFLHQNNAINYYDGYIIHEAWGELNFNYSRIIVQNKTSYLSAGITVAYMKGFSGAFADLTRINFHEDKKGDGYSYVLEQGAATAEYSANYGVTSNSASAQNMKNFIKASLHSAGLDIGAEYLFRGNTEWDNDAVNNTNYDWKIGVSIMDIGSNRFNPIDGSFFVNNPKQNITDSILNTQLSGVKNIRDLRDTLSDFFNENDKLRSRFNISLPTRAVISIDRNFGSNFYVNGQASLNFYSTQPLNALHTKDNNLLTVTTRWETAAFGIYLPVQYNSQGLVWVGGAIKIGPLLIGVHSLDIFKWFQKGTQTFNGGGYILLSIHSFKNKPKPDRFPCPVV